MLNPGFLGAELHVRGQSDSEAILPLRDSDVERRLVPHRNTSRNGTG